jgi:colicin import membrane protein
VRGGLVTSVLLHAAILGWALFTIQSQRQLRMPEPDPIAIDIISASELTKLRQGARTAKELETKAKETPKADIAKKEAPKPAHVATAPPPPPPEPEAANEAEKAPPPKAEVQPEPKKDPIAEKLAAVPPPPAAAPPIPSADAQKKLDEMLKEQERRAEEQKKLEEQKQAEEQKKAEEKKKADEQKRAELKKREEDKKKKLASLKKKKELEAKRREAEAKKKQFDAEKISALLNKIPDKGAPPPATQQTHPTNAKGPALGAPEGHDQEISANELAILKSIISSRLRVCWRLPSGGGGSDTPKVTLKWRMNRDGSIDGDPQIEQPRGDTLFRIAAEAAMRAVLECAPFPLPPDKYEQWKIVTWEFDPSQML